VFKNFQITMASSQVLGDQIEELQTKTTIDAVYNCTTDALMLLVTPQTKCLKYTNGKQPTSSLPATGINQNKNKKEAILSDDDQIKSVPLAAPAPIIIDDQTM
ncbi:43681_t:CDS:2, partial [Gigaspora margarita]